jgi:hypothetical protein
MRGAAFPACECFIDDLRGTRVFLGGWGTWGPPAPEAAAGSAAEVAIVLRSGGAFAGTVDGTVGEARSPLPRLFTSVARWNETAIAAAACR